MGRIQWPWPAKPPSPPPITKRWTNRGHTSANSHSRQTAPSPGKRPEWSKGHRFLSPPGVGVGWEREWFPLFVLVLRMIFEGGRTWKPILTMVTVRGRYSENRPGSAICQLCDLWHVTYHLCDLMFSSVKWEFVIKYQFPFLFERICIITRFKYINACKATRLVSTHCFNSYEGLSMQHSSPHIAGNQQVVVESLFYLSSENQH